MNRILMAGVYALTLWQTTSWADSEIAKIKIGECLEFPLYNLENMTLIRGNSCAYPNDCRWIAGHYQYPHTKVDIILLIIPNPENPSSPIEKSVKAKKPSYKSIFSDRVGEGSFDKIKDVPWMKEQIEQRVKRFIESMAVQTCE